MARTLELNCPRCGREVTFEISRAAVEVTGLESGGYSPEAHYREMLGLRADVYLLAEHRC